MALMVHNKHHLATKYVNILRKSKNSFTFQIDSSNFTLKILLLSVLRNFNREKDKRKKLMARKVVSPEAASSHVIFVVALGDIQI